MSETANAAIRMAPARDELASPSSPISSKTMPPVTGSQISMLKSGVERLMSPAPYFQPDEPAEQHREPDDHRKSVGIEIARLELPQECRQAGQSSWPCR